MFKPVRNLELYNVQASLATVKAARQQQSRGERWRRSSSRYVVKSVEEAENELKEDIIAMTRNPLNQYRPQTSIFLPSDLALADRVRKRLIRIRDKISRGEDVTTDKTETQQLLDQFLGSIDPRHSILEETGGSKTGDAQEGEKDDAAGDGGSVEDDEDMADTHSEENAVQTEVASMDTSA